MNKLNDPSSMSSRQQFLYILQMSQQEIEWDNKDEVAYVNPNVRFEELMFAKVSFTTLSLSCTLILTGFIFSEKLTWRSGRRGCECSPTPSQSSRQSKRIDSWNAISRSCSRRTTRSSAAHASPSLAPWEINSTVVGEGSRAVSITTSNRTTATSSA